jgi:hypothetical protein
MAMAHLAGQPEAVALQALRLYTDRLMSYPNVVGLALAADGAQDQGRYVIKVYVSKKANPTRLLPEHRIPGALSLRPSHDPRTVVRVPTRVEEVGGVRLSAIF